MTAFSQEAKDKGHKLLDRLIGMVTDAAIEACDKGNAAADAGSAKRAEEYHEARDTLYQGLAALYAAKGHFGRVKGPDVSTRSGDK